MPGGGFGDDDFGASDFGGTAPAAPALPVVVPPPAPAAALVRMRPTPTTAGDPYGTDIDCLMGHGKAWGLASGPRNVANALGRRLITRRGGLFYDPDYGFDTRAYLGVALTRGKLTELVQGIESECLKDERVQGVVAKVKTVGNPSVSMTISLTVTLANGPTFDAIMEISKQVPGAPVISLVM